ncbi:MAG: FecCD family ABC transporter permease [Egibacteraceae bacterium]
MDASELQATRTAPPSGGFDVWRRRRSSFALVMAGLGVLVAVSVTLSLGIGPVRIAPGEVWRIVVHRVLPGLLDPDWAPVRERILLEVRLPRVLLGAVVGAGLSVVGVTLQALVRNPLADPHIIGITEGASVGATAVLLLGLSPFGVYSLSAAAFLGAFGALALVYMLAQRGRRLSAMRLILAGVAVAYLLSATTSFLIFQAATGGDATRLVVFWLLGGLGAAQWSILALPAAAVAGGAVFLVLRARGLDALLVGEETAASLGVDTSRFRKQLFVAVSLLAGVMVAVAGGIGFVALMMPHIVRLLVGSAHRRVLPAAALAGAVFLVWADVLARTLFAPEELPIGIITAFCGAPFFIWLMRSRRSGRMGSPL